MQDSGKPEDAGTAKPEGAETEATRGTISRSRRGESSGQPGDSNRRQSRKVQARGNPPPHQEAQLEERSRGATRGDSARGAEGREKRGNSRLRRRHSRKMLNPGATQGKASAGATGRAWLRGKLQATAPCVLKDRRFGATRRLIAGKAGRCEGRGNPERRIGRRNRRSEVRGDLSFTTGCAEGREKRGNSKIRRRQSLRMQDAGQLATSSGGATGRAWPRGATLRLERRACQRMRETGQLESPSRAQP